MIQLQSNTCITLNAIITAIRSFMEEHSHTHCNRPSSFISKCGRKKVGRVAALSQVRESSELQLIFALREISVQVFEWDNTDSGLGHQCFHPEQPGQKVSTPLSRARAWTRCSTEMPSSLIFSMSLWFLSWQRWQERKRNIFRRELTGTHRSRSQAETRDSQWYPKN